MINLTPKSQVLLPILYNSSYFTCLSSLDLQFITILSLGPIFPMHVFLFYFYLHIQMYIPNVILPILVVKASIYWIWAECIALYTSEFCQELHHQLTPDIQFDCQQDMHLSTLYCQIILKIIRKFYGTKLAVVVARTLPSKIQ